MSYIKLPFVAGTYPDDTPLAAEGYSVQTDKGRFVRNKFQTCGGNELASEDTFNGICRALFTWRDNTAQAYCAIGTHTELDVYYDANIYEITPVVARGQLTNPFTASLGSAIIAVSFAGHGMSADQRIAFPGQTSFDGADISSDHGYAVTVTSVNGFTFVAGSAATSSGSGGGTVNYDIYLAPGLEDGTGGAGYGTGAYGVGLYGGDNTQAFYLRTWSLDNWGQNLLASPRGGAIYEWAPNFTATELVTNGDFSSATGWTQGTGWLIGGGVATASQGTASSLSTSISLAANAHFLIEFDMTCTGGSLSVKVGATTVVASLNSSQHYESVFYTAPSTQLAFSKDTSFAGTLDNVMVTQLTTAEILAGAPIENTFMLVTPEQIVMVFGTIDVDSGLFDPLGIRWSDTGRGDLSANQTWTPDPSNLAGGTHLAKGGRIVAGRVAVGGVLAWTDTALYYGPYVPDTNVVYDFQLVAEGCGLIGPNAVSAVGGTFKWMTPAGEFMMWAGGTAVDANSTMGRDIYDHISFSQQDKVFAFPSSRFNEVWWLYPDIRDGNECSRYGQSNGDNQWANGTASWDDDVSNMTAWTDIGPMNYPMAASTAGMLFFQEKGNSFNGAPLIWSRLTGVIPVGDGNTLFGIRSFFPNVDDWLGGFTLTVYMSNFPNGTFTTFGPYSVSSGATKVDLGPTFPTGKFAQFLIEGNAAPAFAREGVHMIDIYDTGMVF